MSTLGSYISLATQRPSKRKCQSKKNKKKDSKKASINQVKTSTAEMSDFVSNNILDELWEEILKRHWTFLDTEEGKEKFEERKQLEGCLKQFLCIVSHDRKFFLPETAQVLRQSVRDLDDFTAHKAIDGFEAVSQYANNLFTKPWRKEFRILKTYSGFYQHEIESNLVNAVKLFEAMGYRRLSDDTLVLDGPICPDQVTNVSRDAMTAYVECQIMKYIYSGLSAMGIKCSWQDIFHYREKYISGTSQAIKDIATQDTRRRRKEKLLNDNSYATIQHVPAPPPPPLVSQCLNCAPYHHGFIPTSQQQLPCALHGNQMKTGCAVHPTKVNVMCNGISGVNSSSNNKMYTTYGTGGPIHCHNHTQTPAMSHSRSLEHYNEPAPLLPHRHSFDHQQQGCTAHQSHYQVPRSHIQPYAQQHLYESPYDCIDGGVGMQGDDSMDGSSVSYAAVAASQAYNVSGNRIPLPYNISNQINSHYSVPAPAAATTVTCNGVNGLDMYGNENLYATVSKPTHSCGYHSSQQQRSPLPAARLLSGSKDFQNYHQRSFPPDQLIDFDDRALLIKHDYHANQHHLQQMQKNCEHTDRLDHDNLLERQLNQRRVSHSNGLNATYAEPKDLLCQQRANTSSDDAYGNNSLYARPVPRSSRLKDGGQSTKQTTDKYLRKIDCIQGYQDDNNRKYTMELNDRSEQFNGGGNSSGGPRRKLSNHSNERDYSDLSYESAGLDDFVTVGHSEHPQRSPTQAIKNQDGVGSFEDWDFVFQNLDRSGYSKDLGDQGDLLVQGLDLDSMNLGGTASGSGGGGGGGGGGVGATTNTIQNVEKRRGPINSQNVEIKPVSNPKPSVNGEKLNASAERRDIKTTKQTKTSSILKTSTSNTANNTAVNNNIKTKAPKSALKSANTLSVDHSKSNGNTIRNIKRQSSTGTTRLANDKQVPVATQIVVSSPNEWSCRFCTFLNPDTKRICEMCSRSKDFNLEATAVSNTPTCV